MFPWTKKVINNPSPQPRHHNVALQKVTQVGASFWGNRYLIWQMTSRELSRRYRGSFLGFIWTLITPLVNLTIYTFVFSVVFRARWGNQAGDNSQATYALSLFTGLIAFNMFAEVITQSSTLILANPNFVRKVVFPVEILSIISLNTAFINSLFSLLILFGGMLIFNYPFHWTILLFPLVYLPLFLIVLGLSWFVSSVGVFIRDVDQLVRLATQLLMFITPVFYPLEMVPEEFQPLLATNPLTFVVSSLRKIILFGEVFPLQEWLFWLLVSVLIATLGYIWFQKSRSGFADVM